MIDQEEEHVAVVAISFRTFGNKHHVRKMIYRIGWLLQNVLHRQVEISGFSYTDHGGLISQGGEITLSEFVSKAELSV